MGEDLQDLGEFGLIRRLIERLPASEGIELGPGDDTAILGPSKHQLLATADALIEGVHFDLAFSSYADVGYKAMAVNTSDVAAMGGTPRWALVTLGAHPSARAADVESLYDGLAEGAREFGVGIAGGDTVRSDRLIVWVAMIGEAERTPVRRDGARTGDALVVTGPLGAAVSGLLLMRAAMHDPDARTLMAKYPALLRAHQRGRARVPEGKALADAGAHAMIDISDGLVSDVGHICERSHVGAVIGDVPVAEGVAEVAAWLGEDATTLALAGGDDYELAAALPAEVPGVLRVGTFVSDGGVRLASGGPVPAGWDHFLE